MAESPPIHFTFGKHRGKSFEEVRQQDPGYVRWAKGDLMKSLVRSRTFQEGMGQKGTHSSGEWTPLEIHLFSIQYLVITPFGIPGIHVVSIASRQ